MRDGDRDEGAVGGVREGGEVRRSSYTAEQLVVATVGKVDAKKRIEDSVMQLMSTNIVQLLGTMLDTVVLLGT